MAFNRFTTAVAAAVLLIAVVTPGADAAVLCDRMPGPVTNSASSPASPAWLNGDGDPCVNQTVATVCTANCRPGYTSVPTPTITCQDNGTWTAATGTCKAVCTDPPTVNIDITWGSSGPGGNNNCAASIAQKASCVGTCKNGKSGSPIARCVGDDTQLMTTSWTQTGGCVGAGGCAFGPTSVPTNANRKGLPSCISGENNTVCDFQCNSNYVADTPAGVIATCVNGAWVNSGKCLKACATAPTSATITWDITCAGKPAGYVCQGVCLGGAEGSPTITCSAGGTWTRQTGACAPAGGCPTTPLAVTNAAPAPATCAGAANNSACTYTCNNGSSPYTTYGPSDGAAVTRTCNSGTWSDPSAKCIPVCRASTLPTLGAGTWAACTAIHLNGACMATCGAGLFGAPYSVCSSTGFSAAVGDCSATKVCAGVPSVMTVNGGWPEECANTPVGGACDILCNNNYVGTASVECVPNAGNLVTGANWATNFTGTMCAAASLGRNLI